jgi:DNA helicase HerA-like ATPase
MKFQVGEVISIKGTTVILKIFEESNKETLFYEGTNYKGVSIREYLTIRRGFTDIVCLVEGEYLDESSFNPKDNKPVYIRKIETRPIGYFKDGEFCEGIKYLPMIKDPAFLITENSVKNIFGNKNSQDFVIGKLLKEDMPISLPWRSLFNTHIGIFGNTGSGKSNTLTSLYTKLFSKDKTAIFEKSKFYILDFNGEYTDDQMVTSDDKQVIHLNSASAVDQLNLPPESFWSEEILSILFKATENTQKPFLSRVINGRERFLHTENSLTNYFKKTATRLFTAVDQKKESIDLLKEATKLIEDENLLIALEQVIWHSTQKKFYIGGTNNYFDGGENDRTYQNYLSQEIANITAEPSDVFEELKIRVHLQLINDLLANYVQFEFIQPLLKRMDSSLSPLKKVLSFEARTPTAKGLTVISLRKCNQEIKKIIPLIFAKQLYDSHKAAVMNRPENTVHLIIDEAHNILSEQSNRERESWKDYRLELFEEIIKEGRKFGMYLTISSQRPADISPTIMSQLHNLFIHRLVNDRDLLLLDNTISTLDSMSRAMIPNLGKGCCIVTGTSFDIPYVMQVTKLQDNERPNSDDVDLQELWHPSSE